MRRAFTFNDYHTWHDWRLTLTAKDVTPAEPKTNYVDLEGAHGSLDLSEALTGEVAFNDREVVASFVSSEGTFRERVGIVGDIVTAIHGRKVKIFEPDDPEHYFMGRCRMTKLTQTEVQTSFTIEATCEPWRYAAQETDRWTEVSGDIVDMIIHNYGVKTLCPLVKVVGSIRLTFNGIATELEGGTYKISDLRLTPGVNEIRVSGSGSVHFIYREAML